MYMCLMFAFISGAKLRRKVGNYSHFGSFFGRGLSRIPPRRLTAPPQKPPRRLFQNIN